MKTSKKNLEIPDIELLEAELSRERYRKKYRSVLMSTVYSLIIAVAVAVLVTNLLMPVFRIYGHSMSPTLQNGEIVVSLKGSRVEAGDVVAFYCGNKILIKRVIAETGDWIDIEDDGTVYVNNEPLDEPYISEKALGECNIKLPYQVPGERVFLMGDNRSVSLDSRSTAVGSVSDEQIIGKVTFRIWPLTKFGKIY